MKTCLSLILSYITGCVWAQTDSVQKQLSLQAHTGFIIPHAADLRAISQSRPAGFELSYSRTNLRRAAYERCNCFARVGAYVNYYAFNNPAELGRTVGAGAFFEPLINYGKPIFFSVRATAGLAYVSRTFDAESNPRNTFFGAPLNGLMALSASTHVRLSEHLQGTVTASYNHISNGGTRQPNRGMNFPTLGVGLTYSLNAVPFPNPRQWTKPELASRFTMRLMPFASIRTLPRTDVFAERATWLWGITATAGYRLNRFNALTGGLEVVHDGFVREQARRDGLRPDAWQLALLGGYELWLGRYTFATHVGYNLHQPAIIPDGPVFQRYQLLYNLGPRIRVGVGLKARLNVAEGFDVRAGIGF
ncbi:acyloxyacyl hydrolase [Spirosoma montaniterrae]|uniref:Lipid A 3-O-deacylase n=1 Tax=Spirosoma montaniterrae TaxID=1178516 RepID=A0A1P9X3M1_9BACT|nr:acyloxyacyl hydrolase [Spirosoma montaniterrae]AQG82195.1 hypothetical protein AWR27_24610 [Spirosoma montaniterrae]